VRQRGSILFYIVLAIALLGLIAAITYRVTDYLEGLDQQGYDRGKNETKAAYERRHAEDLAAVNRRIIELEAERDRLAREILERVAAIDALRTKEVNDVKAKAVRDVARIRADALKLRDPGYSRAERACSGGSETPAAAGGAGVGDGAAKGGLPGSAAGVLSSRASEFLITLVGEADALVVQLDAAQDIIVAFQRACQAR